MHADKRIYADTFIGCIFVCKCQRFSLVCRSLYTLAKLGVFQCIARDLRQIRSGGIMLRTIQAVWVFKMRVFQTKLLHLEIHQVNKFGHTVRAGKRQCHRSVIAGMEQHPVKQLTDRQRFSDLEIHRRTFDFCRLGRYGVFHIEGTMLQHHDRCHDLGRACDQRARVCVVRK